MTDQNVVRIFGLEDTADGRTDRRLFQRADDLRVGWGEVPVDRLKERVATFLVSMREVLADLPQPDDGFTLEQIQVTAEISTKGQVSLLGTGGELAGKAGLTFTFRLTEPGDHGSAV